MAKKEKSIIVGKPRRQFKSRLSYLLLLALHIYWGWMLGHYLDLIIQVTKVINLHIAHITIPVCIFAMLALYVSICVRCTSSWRVDDEFFCYNDDSSLSVIQKLKAMKEIFKKGYFSTNTHLYRYDEISYVKLYYREHFSYMGYWATTQYFKIYFEDGSFLDAPFKLDKDGPKTYAAFQKMKEHGVYLEDPHDLLTLLKNNELLDLRGKKP